MPGNGTHSGAGDRIAQEPTARRNHPQNLPGRSVRPDDKVEREVPSGGAPSDLSSVRGQVVCDVSSRLPATPFERAGPTLPVMIGLRREDDHHLCNRRFNVLAADRTHHDMLAGHVTKGTGGVRPRSGIRRSHARLSCVDGSRFGRSARCGLAQHESVAVWGSHAKLAHSPRLVRGWFQDLRARVDRPVMEGVDVIDAQIRHIAVIAELRCGHGVRAASEHDVDRAGMAERPVAGLRISCLATKDVAIPGCRHFQVVHGENGVRVQDLHIQIVARSKLSIRSRGPIERVPSCPRRPVRSCRPPSSADRTGRRADPASDRPNGPREPAYSPTPRR